jgi:glutamate dehydrogenase
MEATSDSLRAERLSQIDAIATAKLSAERRAAFSLFAADCLSQFDTDDLAQESADDLAGALLSHWQFGQQRQAGSPKVRLINPNVGEDGWASRHSVVEIVNDDMPFLVDSTTVEINRQGLTLHFIVHPLFAVVRDASGNLTQLARPAEAAELPRESWMQIQVDRIVEVERRQALVQGIEAVLADVRASVSDWKAMLARLTDAIAELDQVPASVDPAAVAESRDFLNWLAEDHFTLQGYRQHELRSENGEEVLHLVPGSGLGVLRESAEERRSASFSVLPREAKALARAPLPLLVVTKANKRSTVHRPGYTDYVGVKRYNAAGEVVGEHRFLGLYTSTAYMARVAETPLIRGKVEAIASRAGYPKGSHRAKALAHILETYPRDELLQGSEDELYDTAMGILALGDRQRLRLFLRRDPFDRFISCLVYVPRENFGTELRIRIHDILMAAFAGTSAEFEVMLGEAGLARIDPPVRFARNQWALD